MEKVKLPEMPRHEKELLLDFLADHHEAFTLEEGERGETELLKLVIDTGEAAPQYQPPRRMPFAVRHEVARQLEAGIDAKKWVHSAIFLTMVKSRCDCSQERRITQILHRLQRLNSVTKADKFPLPRIDDLVDQLAGAQYFSSLDLTSSFWQISVHPESQEKTAFSTPQGLFEFLVMPKNAPSVFQRLMQLVLADFNPRDGKSFVSAYIDDMLIFSSTLEEHLEHLRKVIARCQEVNLKLNLVKCRFVLRELEHLGHVVTTTGLKTNPKLTASVLEFQDRRISRNCGDFWD